MLGEEVEQSGRGKKMTVEENFKVHYSMYKTVKSSNGHMWCHSATRKGGHSNPVHWITRKTEDARQPPAAVLNLGTKD